MHFFLDTEWADPIGSDLVSLALVSEDGVYRFYAERDRLPTMPTDFVLHVVYPLLERGPAAMSDQAMTTALRAFLGAPAEPIVLADYPNDLSLLRYVLDGFELSDSEAAACGPIPQDVSGGVLEHGIISMLIEDYFAAHPDAAKRRHHALVDAQALRHAWLVATDRMAAPRWARTKLALQGAK